MLREAQRVKQRNKREKENKGENNKNKIGRSTNIDNYMGMI